MTTSSSTTPPSARPVSAPPAQASGPSAPADPRFEAVWDGDVLVWICHGPLTSLTDVEPLRCIESHWKRLESPETAGVVLDLADSSYLGSLMLESARNVWTRLHARGKRMAVCRTSDVVREILRLARFDVLWPIFDTRAEAVAAVRAAPTQ